MKRLETAQGSSTQVLVDKAGHSAALKMYQQYVSQENLSGFPDFMQDLDALLSHYQQNFVDMDYSSDDEEPSLRASDPDSQRLSEVEASVSLIDEIIRDYR